MASMSFLPASARTSRCFLHCVQKRHGSLRSAGYDQADLAEAREWLNKFDARAIPRAHGEVSFSRSQGAGGQHVNKTDSKATLRYPVKELQKFVPSLLHRSLRSSRYYVSSSDSIRITIQEDRRQQRNLEGCWDRLFALIQELGRASIPGETTQAQVAKVDGMRKAENEARLRKKKKAGEKKQSRSNRGSDY